MKNLYVLGNWKSNKTLEEAKAWIEQFVSRASELPKEVTVIVCPAFHHIPLFDGITFPAHLGSQNISAYAPGAYTGEVAAAMLEHVVEYVMIGHSERRKYQGETDEIVAQKASLVIAAGMKPVVCVSDVDQVRALHARIANFSEKGMLLYEPLSAIGTGQADSPEKANNMAHDITNIIGSAPILYGGSVVAANVGGFTSQEYIAGVGVGGASLDPEKFIQVIVGATARASVK